ncbi:MAG: carboxypeptidase-like regulatory domain-containing protein, partial [Gemmatimonadaceae bacterium]
MPLLHVRRLLATALLCAAVIPLSATQLFAQTGILSGTVTDAVSSKPLANAQVQLQVVGGTSYGAVSGENGIYRAVNVPAGVYTVTVRLLGHQPRTYPGTRITANSNTTLDV